LERQRDERSEAEFLCYLLPVLERRIREDVGDLDDTSLARGFSTRSETKSDAHLAEEGRELGGPVVYCTKAHQFGRAVDEIDAGERRADEWADAIEGELKDFLGAVGGEKSVNDLTDRDELSDSRVNVGARMHTL
jgi:hypothetical protein